MLGGGQNMSLPVALPLLVAVTPGRPIGELTVHGHGMLTISRARLHLHQVVGTALPSGHGDGNHAALSRVPASATGLAAGTPLRPGAQLAIDRLLLVRAWLRLVQASTTG